MNAKNDFVNLYRSNIPSYKPIEDNSYTIDMDELRNMTLNELS